MSHYSTIIGLYKYFTLETRSGSEKVSFNPKIASAYCRIYHRLTDHIAKLSCNTLWKTISVLVHSSVG